jgi:hypothetical protein
MEDENQYSVIERLLDENFTHDKELGDVLLRRITKLEITPVRQYHWKT